MFSFRINEVFLFILHSIHQRSLSSFTACAKYIFKELHLSFSGKTNEKLRTKLGKQFAGKICMYVEEKQVERKSHPQGSNNCQSNACTHPRHVHILTLILILTHSHLTHSHLDTHRDRDNALHPHDLKSNARGKRSKRALEAWTEGWRRGWRKGKM